MTKAEQKALNKVRRLYHACTGKTISKDPDLADWILAIDTIERCTEYIREETLHALNR